MTVESSKTSTSRDARLQELERRRAEEQLAGRTVWCVAALPGGREAAWALRNRLRAGSDEGGVSVACLVIAANAPLSALGGRLEAMLRGLAGEVEALSREDRAEYSAACLGSEGMLGHAIATGDIVVLHDAVAAVTAEAARDRGAHVVWRIDAAASPAPLSAAKAWDFMRPRARGVDGYVGDWAEPGAGRGRIGAVVPSTGAVTAREVGATDVPDGWSGALAALVQDDRHETVGGTVHARPTVAVH
jgi:hypothetical protein